MVRKLARQIVRTASGFVVGCAVGIPAVAVVLGGMVEDPVRVQTFFDTKPGGYGPGWDVLERLGVLYWTEGGGGPGGWGSPVDVPIDPAGRPWARETYTDDGRRLTYESGASWGGGGPVDPPPDPDPDPAPDLVSGPLTDRGAWIVTGPNNGLSPIGGPFVWAGDEIATDATDTNLHAHYGFPSSRTAYAFAGRMKIDDAAGGIGITVGSAYPDADVYFRFRRYVDRPGFHFSPHGATADPVQAGDGDFLSPAVGQWVRFFVVFDSTQPDGATRIRATFWADRGEAETGLIPDDAVASARSWTDSRPDRVAEGTVGIWCMGPGRKTWGALSLVPLGATEDPPRSDLNGDGVVDLADFAIMANEWGRGQ